MAESRRAALEALGLSMPGSIEAFRALVEAQDLTTEAGRAAYAALLQLAPAFADLIGAAQDAASAGGQAGADVVQRREAAARRQHHDQPPPDVAAELGVSCGPGHPTSGGPGGEMQQQACDQQNHAPLDRR